MGTVVMTSIIMKMIYFRRQFH